MKKLFILSLLVLSTSLWAIQVGDTVQYTFHQLDREIDHVSHTVIAVDDVLGYDKVEVNRCWTIDTYWAINDNVLTYEQISNLLARCNELGTSTALEINGQWHPACKIHNGNYYFPIEPNYFKFNSSIVWIGYGPYDGILKYQFWNENGQPGAYLVTGY